MPVLINMFITSYYFAIEFVIRENCEQRSIFKNDSPSVRGVVEESLNIYWYTMLDV